MTDQTRTWLTRGAIAVGIFVVGLLAGWIGRGLGGAEAVSTIAFYDDWRLACPAAKDKKGTCEMATDLVDPRSGTRLAQLTMGRQLDKPATQVIVLSVPLTVLIPPGVGLQLGTATPQTYKYVTCVPAGCIAMIPVDDKLLSALSAAPSAMLLVTAENGKTVSLPISVKGYGAARKALENTEGKRQSAWRRLWS